MNDEDVKQIDKVEKPEREKEHERARRLLKPCYGSSWYIAYASGIEGGWISGVTDEYDDLEKAE